MVSRARLKARKEAEAEVGKSAYVLKGSEAFPFGSVMRTRLEQFERNEGVIKVQNIASYDGKGISLPDLVACLHILTDPTHKENRWACLVEMVKYDDDIYLRLVPSIPLEVKAKWEATGKPPRQMVSNDIGYILKTLKNALPSKPTAKKPPAKKAKKALAKKQTTVDQELGQLAEAFVARYRPTPPWGT